jgi:hypothetical protein
MHPDSPRLRRHPISIDLPLLFAVLLSLCAVSAHGQEATPRPDVTIIGYVVDSATGTPLPGAAIELPELDRRTLADDRGRFVLTGIPRGEYRVVVRQIGYQDHSGVRGIDRDPTTLTIALGSRPIMLDGVTVEGFPVARELRMRRFSRGDASQAITREELLRFPGMDVSQLIAQRRRQIIRYNTGFRAPSSAIFIDERPSCIEDLEMYEPDQIFQIEIYGMRHIRVYTVDYVERLGRENRRLPMLNLLARGRGCDSPDPFGPPEDEG